MEDKVAGQENTVDFLMMVACPATGTHSTMKGWKRWAPGAGRSIKAFVMSSSSLEWDSFPAHPPQGPRLMLFDNYNSIGQRDGPQTMLVWCPGDILW